MSEKRHEPELNQVMSLIWLMAHVCSDDEFFKFFKFEKREGKKEKGRVY